MRKLAAVVVAVVLLGGASALRADDALDKARALFSEGEFLPGVEMAEQLGTADSLAFAAQGLAYYAHFVAAEDDRLALLEKAVGWAEAALALDGKNAEVRVQMAHTLGRYSQQFGIMDAITEGFASRIRDQIDAALELEPDNASAHMLLANWHAEIIDSAGFIGRTIYGADPDEVVAHTAAAIAARPDDLLLRIEYANALTKIDDEEYAAQIRAQLEVAANLPVDGAFEKLLQFRAQQMLNTLKAGN